ncbi:MAG: cation:proton antiporter [Rikenellaceae bacterium]
MMLLVITLEHLTRPIEGPVLKFLILLTAILFAPLIFNKLKIPHILGLILAGAIIGPNGFNLVDRDAGVLLSGTAGMLYIMFLAGLEIDFNEFIRNSFKSVVFGIYSFMIPLGLGFLTGYYLLEFNFLASLLLGSMFASHTLITYPIISKLGIKRNRAVTITIGGTVIADTCALLVLAVIVGLSSGEVDTAFWTRLSLSVLIFGAIVLVLFPIITRAFFKRVNDGLLQYVFVLFMVFLGATLAEVAGIEAIIGAFLVGLALNRQIPHSSALMNRIEFIGNAIFIPFFLISVGMLIDYRAFITGWDGIYVAAIMIAVATTSKYLAAYLAQKSFGFTIDERRVIFGLSNARVAATLAAVLVGYNTIYQGLPLIGDSVLNGTIIMIFATCTIASFSAQKGAHNISLKEVPEHDKSNTKESPVSRILLPIHNSDSTEELIGFANLISSTGYTKSLVTVATVINSESDASGQLERAKRLFEKAVTIGSAADVMIDTCLRYDTCYTNGIQNLIREHEVTDLLLDVDPDKFVKGRFLSKFADTTIVNNDVTTYLYRSCQPIQTIKRYIIIAPPHAEREFGFRAWVTHIWSLLKNTSASAIIYADSNTLKVIEGINQAMPIPIQTNLFTRYQDLLIVAKDIKPDDALIFVLSRRNQPSYNEHMEQIPYFINNYFSSSNFVLIYPQEYDKNRADNGDLMNPTSNDAVCRIDDIVKGVTSLLNRRG